MSKISFGTKGGRVKATVSGDRAGKTAPARSPEDAVREMKADQKAGSESYRERSLAIHGLICARCAREFDHTNRHLLTVHHKDGNHDNNPPDGSNWENLCVYCHENEHSRGILGEYLDGKGREESTLVYSDQNRSDQNKSDQNRSERNKTPSGSGLGSLGAKLQEALKKKK